MSPFALENPTKKSKWQKKLSLHKDDENLMCLKVCNNFFKLSHPHLNCFSVFITILISFDHNNYYL